MLSKAAKCLWAGLVADAATMPVHWIYSFKTLVDTLKEEGLLRPEFFNSKPPFYNSSEFPGHYTSGKLSVYGEQTVAVLEYLSENTDYSEITGETFAGFLYLWFKNYTGRKDHATKLFLEAADKLKQSCEALFPKAAPDDCQLQFSFKAPAVLLLKDFSDFSLKHYPMAEMLHTTELLIKAHQNNDVVINHGLVLNLMLCFLFSNTSSISSNKLELFSATLENILSNQVITQSTKVAILTAMHETFDLQPALSKKSLSLEDLQHWTVELSRKLFDAQTAEEKAGKQNFRDMFAITCNNPGAFTIAVKVVLDTLKYFFGDGKVSTSQRFKSDGFAFAVRRNLLLCGDNCGRSMIIGSLISALGADLPTSFVEKVDKRDKERIFELITRING